MHGAQHYKVTIQVILLLQTFVLSTLDDLCDKHEYKNPLFGCKVERAKFRAELIQTCVTLTRVLLRHDKMRRYYEKHLNGNVETVTIVNKFNYNRKNQLQQPDNKDCKNEKCIGGNTKTELYTVIILFLSFWLFYLVGNTFLDPFMFLQNVALKHYYFKFKNWLNVSFHWRLYSINTDIGICLEKPMSKPGLDPVRLVALFYS